MICTNPSFQTKFANLLGKESPTELSGFLIALFFGAVIYLYHLNFKKTSEPFLFEVSKYKPRLNGLYEGIPTTFQYDSILSNYNCSSNQTNPDMPKNNESIRTSCIPDNNPPLGKVGTEKDTFYGGNPRIFSNY